MLPYQKWLSHDEIDISCVMGCQNWAMLALGDVASIKTQVADTSPREVKRRIADITKRLEDGIGYLSVIEKVCIPLSSILPPTRSLKTK